MLGSSLLDCAEEVGTSGLPVLVSVGLWERCFGLVTGGAKAGRKLIWRGVKSELTWYKPRASVKWALKGARDV